MKVKSKISYLGERNSILPGQIAEQLAVEVDVKNVTYAHTQQDKLLYGPEKRTRPACGAVNPPLYRREPAKPNHVRRGWLASMMETDQKTLQEEGGLSD